MPITMHHSPSRVEKPKKLRAACDFCRQSKVRCSGGNPCSGCKALNITCIYGTSNRMGRPRGAKNKKTIEKIQQYQAKVEQKLCKSATTSICGSENLDTEDDEQTFDLDNPFLESADASDFSKLDFGLGDGESVDELDRLLDIRRDGSREVGPSGIERHGDTGTDDVCEALARCGGFDVVDSAAIPWFELPPDLSQYKHVDSDIAIDEHAGFGSRNGRSSGVYGQETTPLFTNIQSSAHGQTRQPSMSTNTAQSPTSMTSHSRFSTTSSGQNTPALSACTPTTEISTYFSPRPDFTCQTSSKPALLSMSTESPPSSRSLPPTSCTCLHDQAALLSRIAITSSSASSASPDSTLATLKSAIASWNDFLACSLCKGDTRTGSCVDVLFVLASGMRLVIQAIENITSTLSSPSEVSAATDRTEARAGSNSTWSCGSGSYQPSSSENMLVTATLMLNGINQLYEICEKIGVLTGEKSSASQNAVDHRLECVNESFKAMEADVLRLRGRIGGKVGGLLRWSV